ncbi:TATA box-binding protein-like 1 [Onthophagus taurus]|uniref:TATA box-binding protein-like 1 n=1 Tax=Onthophagus taurus TaxID=166361 RepID=UPI000C2045B2|nr:TATA box-binding protein-like protein 1 [Onthophagus taurus]XP_022904029.1 TATA box-binding protein-like protein 1 [Onthophagus taurus]
MATAVQKNGMKPLPNGNGLVHKVSEGLTTLQESPSFHQQDNSIQKINQNLSSYQNDVADKIESDQLLPQPQQQQPEDAEPEIDIVINNVVCSFSVRCHLNLRDIALNGLNVEYRKENGMVTMKLRRPYTTASIWSSGKVTCTGATSEDQAKIAARRFARCLQKLGFNVRFNNYRVVNVLGTCSMPFAIRINSFSERHKEADYEPELHPGVTYKLKSPKATLKIFSTGSVTVTAPSVMDVQAAIEHIFPLVYEFRKERSPEDIQQAAKKRRTSNGPEAFFIETCSPENEEEEDVASDVSWD